VAITWPQDCSLACRFPGILENHVSCNSLLKISPYTFEVELVVQEFFFILFYEDLNSRRVKLLLCRKLISTNHCQSPAVGQILHITSHKTLQMLCTDQQSAARPIKL
jgi:hypothetical protein